MAAPKRIVLFVEGQGDKAALPVLVKDILTELDAWEHVFLDPDCIEVKGLGYLLKDNAENWLRLIRAAAKRPNFGGVLLLLDGDIESVLREPFCAAKFAYQLSTVARASGAGTQFSVASVFARQEFESWIIAAANSIGGQTRSDGLPGLPVGINPPDGMLEEHPRDAKGWLGNHLPNGYSETKDQVALTQQILAFRGVIRQRMRSFRRLENAVRQLHESIRVGKPMVSPSEFEHPS